MTHYFGAFDDRELTSDPLFDGHSSGYTRVSLIDRTSGSVHTGLSINALAPAGVLQPHVHSFEEGFYILQGSAEVTMDGASRELGPGDFGVVPVGRVHAWRGGGDAVRWLQMAAPQPKPPGGVRDTFFARNIPVHATEPLVGHFDATQIPVVDKRPKAVAGLEGVFLKWLIDEEFGARHQRLLFIEYQPGVGIGAHDHAFEEAYFIVSGEVEATLDGNTYRGGPGSVFWTGVGCVHSFRNVSSQPVTWLETFAPQPPKENVFRFVAEWEARARALEG